MTNRNGVQISLLLALPAHPWAARSLVAVGVVGGKWLPLGKWLPEKLPKEAPKEPPKPPPKRPPKDQPKEPPKEPLQSWPSA